METILASCISAAVTLIVCIVSNHSQNEKSRALIEYKITELTRTVEKHNNLIERVYSLEEKTTLIEEKIRVANHRLEDLEKRPV